MYNEHFGLRKSPFNLTPDPELLYLTARHREALAGLTYALMARKGFAVLTGDAGTGKTTLLVRVLRHLPVSRVHSSLIVNPTLTAGEFLEAALLDFGFTDVPASKAQRIANFQNFLVEGRRAGKVLALIVDEAHKLSPEVLEEIRLLGNFDYGGEKLLQIVLVGQPELDGVLGRAELRQLRQRIALRLSIEPLAGADIEQYIRYRWAKAGGGALPFSREALEAIARVSQGIPRVINVICDNALLQAFGEGGAAVEARHVSGACEDLRLLERPVRQETAPAAPAVRSDPVLPSNPIITLERYERAAARPSLLARFASKLGLIQRVETA